ncbi:sugar phosphate nucleotidyltransferase [Gemmatimonadota bacterium]
MQAVILAGGRGNRLRPFTENTPKPMVPLAGEPILEIIIRQLSRDGFRNVVLAVNHLKAEIRSHFGAGERWNTEIRYSEEGDFLGTAGPLSIIDGLEEEFMVVNGDILTDLRFDELFRFHQEADAVCTVASCIRAVQLDFGVLSADSLNVLSRVEEKPELSFDVNMGIYVMKKEALLVIPPEGPYDMPDMLNDLVSRRLRVACFPFRGLWFDLGSPADYQRAREIYQGGEKAFL